MQMFALRLRGVKLVEIGNTPGNAKLRDLKQILARELGGKFEIHFFFCGKLLDSQQRVSKILNGAEPAQDGRFYLLYEATPKRVQHLVVEQPKHRQLSRERYLTAMRTVNSSP